METKVCSKCKQELPYEAFYKDKTKKTGCSSYCKVCNIKTCVDRVKQFKQKNDLYSIQHKKFLKNVEAQSQNCRICCACNIEYPLDNFYKSKKDKICGKRHICKSCSKLRSIKWAKDHEERTKEIGYNFRVNNLEQINRKRRSRYTKDKDKYKKLSADYRKNNPEKVRSFRLNRRAKLKQVPCECTSEFIQELYQKQNGICVYCECKLNHYHVDHIQPISRFGCGCKINLQLLCPTCNYRKNAKTDLEFRHILELEK